MNELKPEDAMKENDFLVRGISKEQLAEERVQVLREGYQATLRKNDALIAKLEAYIDELNEDKSYLVGQIADLQQTVLKKDAEIERLKKELDDARRDCAVAEQNHYECKKELETARSEAITEFAERLKGRFNVCAKAKYSERTVHEVIDHIAKEMREKQ